MQKLLQMNPSLILNTSGAIRCSNNVAVSTIWDVMILELWLWLKIGTLSFRILKLFLLLTNLISPPKMAKDSLTFAY